MGRRNPATWRTVVEGKFTVVDPSDPDKPLPPFRPGPPDPDVDFYACGMCELILEPATQRWDPCPRCGDDNYRIGWSGPRVADCSPSIRSGKRVGRRLRPAQEEMLRRQRSVKTGHPVRRLQAYDRENDQYFERVVDLVTGEEIHKASERLSEHRGHGSARGSAAT